MKVAIATDTNSGIQANENPNIFLLPMPVIINGQTYFEGIDLCSYELYEAMKLHKDVSTSQPAPGQVLDFWEKIFEYGYDEIVYIPMSSGLSSSCHSAMKFAMDYDGKVQVVDNHRISVTQKESAYTALRLAQQGYPAKEIKDYLEECAYHASIYIMVDSLEYLKKGGRITPAVAAFATVLNLKPVLTIQGERLDTYAKARGMRKAKAAMINAIKKDRSNRFSNIPDSCLQIDTAGTIENKEYSQQWLHMVQSEFPNLSITYSQLPCSIACHVGVNAIGIGIMTRGTK